MSVRIPFGGGSVHVPNRTCRGGSIRKLKTIAFFIIKFELKTIGLVDGNFSGLAGLVRRLGPGCGAMVSVQSY